MPLSAGTRIGTYEVIGAIGAGGMGEVYRARDIKLDRDVAIKVLPTHLADNPAALARFEREAKAVAALSHPNILAIHDFGREPQSGVSYAVMELLEGGTLRDRLAAGALPHKKVVQIGVDIAHGLAAAHARGIVHRDLKPENIFVTSDGRVKILDFGLARPLVWASAETASPTALGQTSPGTVLGTLGYMSPEQVRGEPADHRSDIFSLGCVLYELATGRRAFHRQTSAETMTAILRDDPPDLLREGTSSPAAIEPVIRHCLEKQPDERFQSASDLAFALQTLSGATTTPSGAVQVADAKDLRVGRRISIAPLAVAGLLIAAAFAAGRFLSQSSAPSSTAAPPLAFEQLTDDAGLETDPTISPDGASIAFVKSGRGKADILVQRIGGRNTLVVAGDPVREEAGPAFSPDGTLIAFHERGRRGGIFITGATGESERRITDFGFHPAWSPDGTRLVFCTEEILSPAGRLSTSALWTVEVKGGAPTKIFGGDAVQPVWSPSGERIAFWAVDTGQRDLYTIPASGGPRTTLTQDVALDWSPQWSPDGRYLYFASDRGGSMNIWRIAVDAASGGPAGRPEPVTQGVSDVAQPAISKDESRIVFRSSALTLNPVAFPFDPATEQLGAPTQLFDRSGNMQPTAVSPDGRWLAFWNLFERQEDVFVARIDGTGLRRLTDDPFRDRWPVWSPDGTVLTFYSNRTDTYGIWSVKPDGSGLRALTGRTGGNDSNLLYPTYSPTGDRLVASRARANETIMIDPRRPWSEQKPETLTLTVPPDSWLVPTAWSPDGRRLAGAVVGAGGTGIGVGVYDVASRTVRKVADGAADILSFAWLADSRRVLYGDAATGTLFLVDVDSGRRKTLVTDLALGSGLAAAPDRRTLYASLAREQSDLWMAQVQKAR